MPGGDKTGPMGQGEQTGRGLGDCAKAAAPIVGAVGAVASLAYGFARGRGFGWRTFVNNNQQQNQQQNQEQNQESVPNQEPVQNQNVNQNVGFFGGLGRGLGFGRGLGRGAGRGFGRGFGRR